MKKTGKNSRGSIRDPAKRPSSRRRNFSYWWLYYFFIILILLVFTLFGGWDTEEISWQRFQREMLQRNMVDHLQVIDGERVDVYIKKAFANDPAFRQVLKPEIGKEPVPGPHFHFTIGSVESFERRLEEAQAALGGDKQVDVHFIHSENYFQKFLLGLLPLAIILIFWQFIRNRAGGGNSSVLSFGSSPALLFDKADRSPVTFADVAGHEEAKVEIKEIVDFLKFPESYTRLGAKIPKGLIISGPTGTGKTLLVKAVAGEARVPFFYISGSEFVEMYVGVGASRVRDLFRRGKEKAPCIIFIDEIDAVGRSRARSSPYTEANDERESTLNQLLTEMDGFASNSGVIVLAATNRADMLDPALLRPGRFDRHIYLELPNLTERQAIFKVHLRALVLAVNIDAQFLAYQTAGFSGADIANICNEAALIAARNKKKEVELQDFLDAIDRVVAGLERKSKIISATEKRIIAYHEAGHVLVSWLLKHVDSLTKVSIIPRGQSLGAAWYLPEEHQIRTVTEFEEKLCATLGGRAAEEIVFGEVSSGALDDLEQVTKDAYKMVAYYGFTSKIGNVSFYDSTSAQEAALQKPYSEETAKQIDAEVHRIVEKAYEKAKGIVADDREKLDVLAGELLQKEVLFQSDLERILGKRFGAAMEPDLSEGTLSS